MTSLYIRAVIAFVVVSILSSIVDPHRQPFLFYAILLPALLIGNCLITKFYDNTRD